MIEKLTEKLKNNELNVKELVTFFNAYLASEVSKEEVVQLLKVFSGTKDPGLIKKFIEAEVSTGTVLNWEDKHRPVIDKHSTGGVGDKVSLILVPWLSACGFKVAKLSGRALGHTGGTIDKLESIPGVSTSLTSEQFQAQVVKTGCLIAEASNDICPVETKLYELRNETGLVPFLPLVVASILSKKIAVNADVLIFDVKFGKGAFFRDVKEARELAEMLVSVSRLFNKKSGAILTSMQNPLGFAVGNSLEVLEAIDFLSGQDIPGLNEVVYALGIQALVLAGFDEEEAFLKLDSARKSQKALQQFLRMVSALGGPGSITELKQKLPRATVVGTLTSMEKGYIHHIDPLLISRAVKAASKGNNRPETGIKLLVSVGQEVSVDDELCEIHAVDYEALDEAVDILENAFEIRETKPAPAMYVLEKIS